MGSLKAAEAVAAQFEVSDKDVQRCFDQFIRELSKLEKKSIMFNLYD